VLEPARFSSSTRLTRLTNLEAGVSCFYWEKLTGSRPGRLPGDMSVGPSLPVWAVAAGAAVPQMAHRGLTVLAFAALLVAPQHPPPAPLGIVPRGRV
jgi:hypothetical protein